MATTTEQKTVGKPKCSGQMSRIIKGYGKYYLACSEETCFNEKLILSVDVLRKCIRVPCEKPACVGNLSDVKYEGGNFFTECYVCRNQNFIYLCGQASYPPCSEFNLDRKTR